MQIVILLAFAATLTAAQGAPLVPSGWPLAALAPAYPLVAMLLARRAGRSAVAAAGTNRRNFWMAALHLFLPLGSVALVEVGYGELVEHLLKIGGLADWPLIEAAGLLLPFTAALVLAWTQEYPSFVLLHKGAGNSRFSLGDYLAFNLRHHYLFIAAPVAVALLVRGLLLLVILRWMGASQWAEAAEVGSMVVVAGMLFLVAPAMIVRIWRTHPLEAGPLRVQLEQVGGVLGLRFRRILVWETGGMISNAGVMGLIAPIRYVLLTDALLTGMNERQVQAVFAHEAGHVVGHHIFFSALFLVGTSLVVGVAGTWAGMASGCPVEFVEPAILGALLVVWALGFGYVSRRFERQSDVVAAVVMGRLFAAGQSSAAGQNAPAGRPIADGREVPADIRNSLATDFPSSIGNKSQTATARLVPIVCPPGLLDLETQPSQEFHRITPEGAAIFADALQRVADLNGISTGRFNWRHGSIASRIQYVLSLGSTVGTSADIDRTVRGIKIACWLLAVAGVAMTVWQAL